MLLIPIVHINEGKLFFFSVMKESFFSTKSLQKERARRVSLKKEIQNRCTETSENCGAH